MFTSRLHYFVKLYSRRVGLTTREQFEVLLLGEVPVSLSSCNMYFPDLRDRQGRRPRVLYSCEMVMFHAYSSMEKLRKIFLIDVTLTA